MTNIPTFKPFFLKDAFGMGLYNFLRVSGPNLKEITISCGSDADSTFLGMYLYNSFNSHLSFS